MEVTEAKVILGKEAEINGVSALLEGEQHYTADVRFLGREVWAIFSPATKDDLNFQSMKQCVNFEIFTEEEVKVLQIDEENKLTWMQLDLGDLKFTR